MDTPTHQALTQCEERYASSVAEGPMVRARAAFDLSQWLIESLMLRRGGEIALAMWSHALDSLRLSDGMPVQEVVQLVDAAAFGLVELRGLTEGAIGVRRTLDDLVALHQRFRERLAVFNRHSVIPLAAPRGRSIRKGSFVAAPAPCMRYSRATPRRRIGLPSGRYGTGKCRRGVRAIT